MCAVFGLMLALPLAFAFLSARGPVPVAVSAAAWSRYYYVHFILLVVCGFGFLFADAARTRVFHGGPMIDFSIGLAGVMIAFGVGRGWVPGLFLIAFGLRLSTGRPLIS
jgi:hypothetical protein